MQKLFTFFFSKNISVHVYAIFNDKILMMCYLMTLLVLNTGPCFIPTKQVVTVY